MFSVFTIIRYHISPNRKVTILAYVSGQWIIKYKYTAAVLSSLHDLTRDWRPVARWQTTAIQWNMIEIISETACLSVGPCRYTFQHKHHSTSRVFLRHSSERLDVSLDSAIYTSCSFLATPSFLHSHLNITSISLFLSTWPHAAAVLHFQGFLPLQYFKHNE